MFGFDWTKSSDRSSLNVLDVLSMDPKEDQDDSADDSPKEVKDSKSQTFCINKYCFGSFAIFFPSVGN